MTQVKNLRGSTKYKFDAVLESGSSVDSAKVFATSVAPLLDHFVAGGNSAFISYGQKGLGKSKLLASKEGGMITESVRYLFESKDVEGLDMAIQFVTKSSVASFDLDSRSG